MKTSASDKDENSNHEAEVVVSGSILDELFHYYIPTLCTTASMIEWLIKGSFVIVGGRKNDLMDDV